MLEGLGEKSHGLDLLQQKASNHKLNQEAQFWMETAKGVPIAISESLHEDLKTGRLWQSLGQGAALTIGLSQLCNRKTWLKYAGKTISYGMAGMFAWDAGQTAGKIRLLHDEAMSGSHKEFDVKVSAAQKTIGHFGSELLVGSIGGLGGHLGEGAAIHYGPKAMSLAAKHGSKLLALAETAGQTLFGQPQLATTVGLAAMAKPSITGGKGDFTSYMVQADKGTAASGSKNWKDALQAKKEELEAAGVKDKPEYRADEVAVGDPVRQELISRAVSEIEHPQQAIHAIEQNPVLGEALIEARFSGYPKDGIVVFVDGNGKMVRVTYENIANSEKGLSEGVSREVLVHSVDNMAKGNIPWDVLSKDDIVKGFGVFGKLAKDGDRPALSLIAERPSHLAECSTWHQFVSSSKLGKNISQIDFTKVKRGLGVEGECANGVCPVDPTWRQKLQEKRNAVSSEAEPVVQEVKPAERQSTDEFKGQTERKRYSREDFQSVETALSGNPILMEAFQAASLRADGRGLLRMMFFNSEGKLLKQSVDYADRPRALSLSKFDFLEGKAPVAHLKEQVAGVAVLGKRLDADGNPVFAHNGKPDSEVLSTIGDVPLEIAQNTPFSDIIKLPGRLLQRPEAAERTAKPRQENRANEADESVVEAQASAPPLEVAAVDPAIARTVVLGENEKLSLPITETLTRWMTTPDEFDGFKGKPNNETLWNALVHVAHNANSYSRMLFEKGNVAEAESWAGKLVKLVSEDKPGINKFDETDKAKAYSWLGELNRINNKFAEAESNFKQAFEQLSKIRGAAEVESQCAESYAKLLRQQDRAAEAVTFENRLAELARSVAKSRNGANWNKSNALVLDIGRNAQMLASSLQMLRYIGL